LKFTLIGFNEITGSQRVIIQKLCLSIIDSQTFLPAAKSSKNLFSHFHHIDHFFLKFSISSILVLENLLTSSS